MLTIYFIFLLPLLCIYFFCLACLWIKVFFFNFFFLTFLFHFPYCSLTTYDFFHSFLVADLVITVLSLDLLTCHVHWWSSSPTVSGPWSTASLYPAPVCCFCHCLCRPSGHCGYCSCGQFTHTDPWLPCC